jgi:hypothetical protein
MDFSIFLMVLFTSNLLLYWKPLLPLHPHRDQLKANKALGKAYLEVDLEEVPDRLRSSFRSNPEKYLPLVGYAI